MKPKENFKFEYAPNICKAEGCLGQVRADDLCVLHLVERSAAKEAEREKDEIAAIKRRESKDYVKNEIIGRFQSANQSCSVCGKMGLHQVREKAKDRRPINPNNYWEVLEVACDDCVEAGR